MGSLVLGAVRWTLGFSPVRSPWCHGGVHGDHLGGGVAVVAGQMDVAGADVRLPGRVRAACALRIIAVEDRDAPRLHELDGVTRMRVPTGASPHGEGDRLHE